MAVAFGDIDGGLQHQHAKGNARAPAEEADDHEDGEEQEDDAARVVAAGQHVDGRGESEDDVEDARQPHKLLGEAAGEPHVGVAEHDGRDEHPEKEVDGVRC